MQERFAGNPLKGPGVALLACRGRRRVRRRVVRDGRPGTEQVAAATLGRVQALRNMRTGGLNIDIGVTADVASRADRRR